MKKTLVITGASRGIGLATAKLFQQAGYQVANLSRSPMAPEVGTQITADLSDPEWVQNAKESVKAFVSGSDEICLVHNASLLLKDQVQSASENFAKVLQINLLASQQLNELVLPHMKSGSSILYVGSTLSEKAVTGTLSYVTSKHATLGLMRATCQDLMGSGIHTSCVCPGFTDTEMLRDHIGNSVEILDAIAQTNAFGRLGKPEEIADTLLFAAQNPIINGSILHANLGQKES